MKTILKPGTEFCLVVDYGRSIKESKKAGGYNEVSNGVTDTNFPHDSKKEGGGKKKVNMVLFSFPDKVNISSDDAIAEMKAQGYRPATLRELLAFGEKKPNIQREGTIVAFDGRGNKKSAPTLCGHWADRYDYKDHGSRDVWLRSYQEVWHNMNRWRCWFLAVRIHT
jgi:hypothetical protein